LDLNSVFFYGSFSRQGGLHLEKKRKVEKRNLVEAEETRREENKQTAGPLTPWTVRKEKRDSTDTARARGRCCAQASKQN
jgi:hypothetical protein